MHRTTREFAYKLIVIDKYVRSRTQLIRVLTMTVCLTVVADEAQTGYNQKQHDLGHALSRRFFHGACFRPQGKPICIYAQTCISNTA
jgi:hypothetical protein